MIVQKIYFRIVLILLSFVTAFHLGLIVKLIPYNLAWGGQLHNDFEMYLFESISIGINLFLGLVLLMKGNYIKSLFSYKKIDQMLRIFLLLFATNTLANILAKTIFEKSFAGLTLAFVILILKILKIKSLPKITKKNLLF